jgi:excisionase family DNA binding protein
MGGRFEVGQVMTSKELAEYLNIYGAKVSRLAKQGKIPAFRVAEHWRFRLDEIDGWMREGENRNGPATPTSR